MGEVTSSSTWSEELASLIDDGIRYSTTNDPFTPSSPYHVDPYIDSSLDFRKTHLDFDVQLHSAIDSKQTHFNFDAQFERDKREHDEDLKEQIKGFAKAWGELLLDLSKGCKDIVQQSLVSDDSYVVQKIGPPLTKVSSKLRFLNEYLPEDRDPLHAWPVILFVIILALAVLNVNNVHNTPAPPVVTKMVIHPLSASTILLPDGRLIAYHDQGVAGNRARYTLIAPHDFLSSRLSGIPGIKSSLLEVFGVRLVTYDLPGFGESDPHPSRDLNTSAMDLHYLANGLGIYDKFWVLGYSSAAMHAWATLKYIPNRIAGAAFVAPMVNPYDTGMTKEENSKTWERWEPRRKWMYSIARRLPSFLSYFYSRSFFSGKHGNFEEWFSLSLSEKVEICSGRVSPILNELEQNLANFGKLCPINDHVVIALMELDKSLVDSTSFKKFWQRNVEESVKQGNMKPFIEEAMLLVSDWGFSLADLQARRVCPRKGIFPWLNSLYSKAECKLTGFTGPIHLWQGLNDNVVPPSMAQYLSRVLPGVNLHLLPNESHFSYFYFCDECHREMLSTLFGDPLGPLATTDDMIHTENTDQSSLNVLEDDIEVLH